MSGLAIRFHRDGRPVETASITRMLDAVSYRGPDARARWVAGPIGLGHATLNVSREDELERQPLIDSRTGCVIAADARLDNRDEILSRLPDEPAGPLSDAGLILRAYREWGVTAIPDLLGDFAFAIWDPRHQRVVCARDTSGQRPLYVRTDARVFAAASEIHQLFQDPATPIEPDEDAILDFLVPLNVFRNRKDQARTFYRGVSALPAGHLLVVSADQVNSRQYWSLQPAEIRYRATDEYASHFRDLFFRVVASRLRSVHPVGVLLSGGLDSSSVTCAARELVRAGRAADSGFRSFSLVFDGLECDERELIEDTRAKYGFAAEFVPAASRVHSLDVDPRGFLPGPTKPVSELEPVVEAANAWGVRVLLSGDVSDSFVFGSSRVFDSLLRQARFTELFRYLTWHRRWFDDSWRKLLALDCLAPLLPLPVQKRLMSAYLQRSYRRDPTRAIPHWMPAGLRAELGRRNLARELDAERHRRFSSPAREGEYRAIYPPEVTHDYAGWPMQNSRPFADRRLHEFLLGIPPEQKFEPDPSSGEYYAAGKQILRRSMRGLLPESIRTKTKPTHFASLFDEEVHREWPTYEAVFGPSGKSAARERGYVDGPAFWQRLESLRFGFWGQDFLYIHRVFWLETWLRSLTLPRVRLTEVRPRAAPSRFSSGETGGSVATAVSTYGN